MVSLAGLSAAYPGFQKAQGVDLQNRMQQAQVTNAETELAGQAAFGNTLKMFQQQVPGAQPMGGQMPAAGAPQQGPQPPMPGQASMPRQDPLGGPAIGMQPPMPAPPQQPQGMPQGSPQGGGQMQGQLDWRVIMGKVAQANPGAPPQVLAAAVTKFLPLMNQQAQMEWKQMQLWLMAQRTEQGQQRLDTQREQGSERMDIQRGAEERRTEQGQQRLEQGGKRIDLAQERERRIAASNVVRQDQGYQRLEMQKEETLRRREQGDRRIDVTRIRAEIDAAHKRATEVINSYSMMNKLKPEERKALLKEQRDAYDQDIERLRGTTGRSTPEANKPAAEGKTGDRVAPGTSHPVAPQPGQIQDGYKFKGGDPGKPENWEKVNG